MANSTKYHQTIVKLLMVFDKTHATLYQPLQVEFNLYFYTFKQTKVLDLYIL